MKHGEQEGKQVLSEGWYLGGCGEDIRKECKRVNMSEVCTHIWKWKNKTCWNYSKNEGWGDKEDDGGGEFNFDIA
jgi:hypothetical protein